MAILKVTHLFDNIIVILYLVWYIMLLYRGVQCFRLDQIRHKNVTCQTTSSKFKVLTNGLNDVEDMVLKIVPCLHWDVAVAYQADVLQCFPQKGMLGVSRGGNG